MKFIVLLAILACSTAAVVEKDRTITQVVKLLQNMLDKSTKEGDEERTLYGKFKCYCDTNEAEKAASIKALGEQISILESKIAELQGSNGELSSDVAELKANMASNKAAQDDATSLRGKENKAFTAEEADLTQAIAQMKSAITVLSAVGADQTKSVGADNKQFMAGHKASLISMQSEVKDALKAASALMNAQQRDLASAFVQGPFTGTYSSQSGAVMGILKNMRDTFKANLADSTTTEANALKAYNKFMQIKKDAYQNMKDSFEGKQKELGDNDEELSTKRASLAQAVKQQASDQEFMDELLPMCDKKTKAYGNRKMLRANEEAAIAKTISILNSDAAFETFGTTDATSVGNKNAGLKAASFIQMRSVRRHMTTDSNNRNLAKKLLEKAAKEAKSARLAKVVAMLKAENPFVGVLDEINKMIGLIAEEGKADKENLNWCNKERTENDAAHAGKVKDINALETSIDKLDTSINDPKTGLIQLIQETEDSLEQNHLSQKDQTTERTEANVAYQGDVRNLVAAQGILSKAVKVLTTYYDDLAKRLAAQALVQEDPAAPDTKFNDEGQSKQGNDVIEMLEFILSSTNKEEMDAHSDEEKAQAAYEDSMAMLKKEQASAEKSLVKLQSNLATAQEELLQAQEDLKKTTEDKEAIEVYLAKIKPGCDFITTNFDTREKNRKIEKDALEKAVSLIKATPAYKTAMAEAHVEGFGDCKVTCTKDEDHAKCKACMADVTVPAFCAGHAGVKGC